ncbi:MAG: HpcH/HpaI aldolase/citrate lyase family protein [Bacillota bacterium]
MLRTVLFCPADDPKKASKAMASKADAVTLDLEDAVAYSRKEDARQLVGELLRQPPPVKIFVRVNPAGSKYILDDLETVMGLPIEGIMLAKAACPDEVQRVDWLLGLLEHKRNIKPGKTVIIPFIENSGGILKAAEIACCTPRIKALAFGGVDFSQELGLRYPAESEGLSFARSLLVTASGSAGIEPPLDTVFPDIKNIEKLRSEAEIARKTGFQGKLIIHPSHIDAVNAVFTPDAEEIAYAKKVVNAFEESEKSGSAVISVDGRMVEYPIYNRCLKLLELCENK